MDWDSISIIIFYGIILLLFMRYKKRFTIQAKIFALFKTKLGLKSMDWIAKSAPGLVKWFGSIGVVVGYGGMLFIFIFLIKATLEFLIIPGSQPPLAPVLPGVTIPGAPKLSFWHWIISIFVVAVVHEFAHGVLARRFKIKIKSSGFAFLGPILAAFVEPDEKQLSKSGKWKQLSVFAAGPFVNIVFGILFFLLLAFVLNPVQASMFEPKGIIVGTTMEGYPMESTGIQTPFMITSINGVETRDFAEFSEVTSSINPGDRIELKTDRGDFAVISVNNPDNESKAFIGITGFTQSLAPKASLGRFGSLPYAMMWVNLLFLWLFIINIGVGLFNLLPLGPVDGGKMFLLGATHLFKSESKAKRVWMVVSSICLLLIFINLFPWVIKFFKWILGGLLFLIALI